MYGNVNIPRFYINLLDWLSANKSLSLAEKKYFRTLPVTRTDIDRTASNDGGMGYFNVETATTLGLFNENSFFAILGLEGVVDNVWIGDTQFRPTWNDGQYEYAVGPDGKFFVNCEDAGSDFWKMKKNGFAIGSFDGSEIKNIGFRFQDGWAFGSVVLGCYYDMVESPNLSLEITRSYESVDEITTYNGSSISNEIGNRQPVWLNTSPEYGSQPLQAWQIGDSYSINIPRRGRKSWRLKFSFMDSSDLFGPNQLLSHIRFDLDDGITDSLDTNNPGDTAGNYSNNILTDSNFFSQVWHKTLNGSLPFIFQPDGGGGKVDRGNYNHDQFYIARFKDNTLKATQTSLNTYDVSVFIEECW